MEKLKEYDLPYCHESTFVKEILLPELGGECKILSVGLDIDPRTGLGGENLFLQFMYEDTGQIRSYLIRNFEHPEFAERGFIPS
jgi:hypothetical protein